MASGNMKIRIHASDIPGGTTPKAYNQKKSGFQERLLRNSCLACAVLLGILALSNIERPWAQKASGSIEKALTMKIDLDQSIGQMSFVQKIMPESALVFFNLSGETDMLRPVEGALSHAYSEIQPYLMFECRNGMPVYMPCDGTIAAVSQLSDGSWGILIDHGSGRESVIAGLTNINVSQGDKINLGEEIGTGSAKIYFELRESGAAVDPTQRIGL